MPFDLKGMNLVLVARRLERMEEIKKDLQNIHPVEIRIIQADLSIEGAVEKLDKTTESLDIGLVIPNAGAEIVGEFVTVVPGLLNTFYAWENRLIPRTWPVKLFASLIKRTIKPVVTNQEFLEVNS